MASTSTQIASTSSSSSSIPRWTYDAFLSFHGEDTRNSFTDHLHYVLKQKGFNVFRDAEKLERGEYVSDELLKAIQESMYAIVVISANYASSRWCLIELAEIVERMRGTNLRVLPVFYHVDPSDVRNQTGTFAEAFASHEKDPKVDNDKMQKWKAALKEVGNIAGWHVDDGPESKVIDEISRKIDCGLSHNFSNDSKGLVGIESRVEEMESKIGMGLDAVRFLGICGMGGIGKTTLAQVIYERIAYKFEARCFIRNVREETQNHGLFYLQKQLISEILGKSETNIWNAHVATKRIASRIRQRRVLIILDDVDGDEQVKALAGSHDWFGQGSRIIITSRDFHFLKRVLVDDTYEVELLNNEEALELFSWKAFKNPRPEENYVELSKDIVSYAQGLPLALTIFGSMLFDRKMEAWKSARDFLKENPNAEILDKLRISYDGLEDLQKQLFLDIACFFNGTYRIEYRLELLGYHPDFNMRVLMDKSLITMSGGILQMHDLLRKMGQKIVRCESVKEKPGECSRLWREEVVIRVLKNDSGTDAVRGIVLKLPLQKQERLNFEAFSKMKQLQMLEISSNYLYTYGNEVCWDTKLEWHGDPLNFMLSNELCILGWRGYPLESLPASFQSNKLVELIMQCSRIKQLWDGRKSFDKLKFINLSYSKNLIETPDLSGVPNLEQLWLEYCTSLCKVHSSIGFLKRFKCLYLQGCECLEKLPDEMISLSSLETLNIRHCSSLEEIPKYMISGMKCLGTLLVGGTREFPMGSELYPIRSQLISLLIPNSFSCIASSLTNLHLSYCNLSEESIPSDFSYLSSLWSLNLSGNNFARIPDSAWQLSSLKYLDMSYCNLTDGAIPNCLSSLHGLMLSGNKFTRIPDSVAQLSLLRKLELEACHLLQVLPKLPLGLAFLNVRKCPALEFFYNKQMEMWRRTSDEILSSNIDCSFVQVYIDYDGKPFKILHLHPQSHLWSSEKSLEYLYPEVACGPAFVGSGIPEWFNVKSTNSFGTIQLHSYLGSDDYWEGYALFIDYEFREPHSTRPRESKNQKVDERKGNSNSTTFDGGNPNFPIFVCQFQYQVDGVEIRQPLVLCAPQVPSVESKGFWVYIPFPWFRRGELVNTWRSLEVSITTGSPNVDVKECGARLLRDKNDASELHQLLNTIYRPPALGLQSYVDRFSHLGAVWSCVLVEGPIKSNVVAPRSIRLIKRHKLRNLLFG